jgi:hypothetical protein
VFNILEEPTDTNYYIAVTKVRERLSVKNQAKQKFYVERFKLKKVNGVEIKELYQVNI